MEEHDRKAAPNARQRWARTGHILIFTTRAARLRNQRLRTGLSSQYDAEKAPGMRSSDQIPSPPRSPTRLGEQNQVGSRSGGQMDENTALLGQHSPSFESQASGIPLSLSRPRSRASSLNDLIVAPEILLPDTPIRTQLWNLLTCSQFNVLLVAVPCSVGCSVWGADPALTFSTAFLALIPLAHLLGNFTEDLALRSSDATGALLNASFGNATEMIISIFALRAEMYDVIKNSLIGSVLGNMMLVLGSAMIAAGISPVAPTIARAGAGSGTGRGPLASAPGSRISKLGFSPSFGQGCAPGKALTEEEPGKYQVSHFNTQVVRVYVSLLLLASMGFVVPTSFSEVSGVTSTMTLTVSRLISVLMCVGYLMYLWFQLYTHRDMFEDDIDEEESGSPEYSGWLCVVFLALTTVLISIESELLVATLEPTAVKWHLSQAFISVILIPIVGNAAEHATAIIMAYKNKMDIAIGVAVGSSIQISLFVMPFLVIVSWILGLGLDLQFSAFASVVLFSSVLVVMSLVFHGVCHWLAGALLLLAYLMLCVTYVYTPDQPQLQPHSATVGTPARH